GNDLNGNGLRRSGLRWRSLSWSSLSRTALPRIRLNWTRCCEIRWRWIRRRWTGRTQARLAESEPQNQGHNHERNLHQHLAPVVSPPAMELVCLLPFARGRRCALHRVQALAVKLQQTLGVVLRLGGRSGALKSYARRSCAPVPRRHGHELHQIQRNIFVAAPSARTCTRNFIHDSFSSARDGGKLVVFVFEILPAAHDCETHNSKG